MYVLCKRTQQKEQCAEHNFCTLSEGTGRKLGFQDRQHAAQHASLPTQQEAPSSSAAPVTGLPEGPSTSPAPKQPDSRVGPSAAQADSRQPNSQHESTSATQTASKHPVAAQEGSTSTTQRLSAPQQSIAGSQQQPADPPSEGVDPIGLGRPILLFRRDAALEQAESATNEARNRDPDESYYEFTPEDYHRYWPCVLLAPLCNACRSGVLYLSSTALRF